MVCVKAFGEGDFEAPLQRFPGRKAFINATLAQVRGNLKALIADAEMPSQAALQGGLSTHADVVRHQGDFRGIVEGVNATLDAEVRKLAGALLTEIVPSIGKTSDWVRDITAASREQSGEANQIRVAVNQLSHITQQNASASDELAATSEEMTSQVDEHPRIVHHPGAIMRLSVPRNARGGQGAAHAV